MKAFMTLEHQSKELGTLYLELYDRDVPQTVARFVSLLQPPQEQVEEEEEVAIPNNDKNTSKQKLQSLGYQGCTFHRIIPGFMAQGGDIMERTPSHTSLQLQQVEVSTIPAMSTEKKEEVSFPDENFHYTHDRMGTLSMANSGPNTNRTQFIITLRPSISHLNGKHVVFGHVDLTGSRNDTLQALESVACDSKTNRPYHPVIIRKCGIIPNETKTNDAAITYDTVQKSAEVSSTRNGNCNNNISNNHDDENEIDLDDDHDDDNDNDHDNRNSNNKDTNEQGDESTIHVTSSETTTTSKPLSKAESMKLRMRQLKQKMNQARQLNQQAVRDEGEVTTARIMGNINTGSNNSSHKTSNKHAATMYENTNAIQIAKEYNVNIKDLVQPAYDYLSQQQKRTEKEEIQQYAMNDYHNPEGQYRNYQKNIKSLISTRHDNNNNNGTGDNHNNHNGLYDPTDIGVNDVQKQRDGAHRIAMELQRRYRKRNEKELKRKSQQISTELNNTTSSTTIGSGINLRNQKFNEKIARTYNNDTAEIRHNLERGTAL